jgi:phosphoglucosamine mutase
MKEAGTLKDDTLVVTVMSNLGLKLAMKENGINVVETGVGDRYVLEAMRQWGYNLGGEQSGHVIMADYATTGDGVLTGLQIASRMAATGKSLKELGSVVKVLPQVLINVRGVDKHAADTNEAVLAAVKAEENELGETGRVLLRPSGTEPVVRVMVEATDKPTAEATARRLAQVVQTELALA